MIMNNKHRIPRVLVICAIDITVKVLVSAQIRGLEKAGYLVDLVCSKGPYSDGLREDGFRLINIEILRRFHPIFNLLSIFRLYCLIKQERYDIVHVHTPVAAVLGRIAAKLARTPIIIYTAHGFYFHENMPKIERRFYILLERFCGLLTDHILLQSEEDRITAITERIIDRTKVTTIGNGVDITLFDKPRLRKPENIERVKIQYGIPRTNTATCPHYS